MGLDVPFLELELGPPARGRKKRQSRDLTVLSHYKLFPLICYASLGRLSTKLPFHKANETLEYCEK